MASPERQEPLNEEEGPEHAAEVREAASEQAAEALLAIFEPTLDHITARLADLEEAQTGLSGVMEREVADLSGDSLVGWNAALATFSQIPEYRSKIERLRRSMRDVSSQAARARRTSEQLRQRAEAAAAAASEKRAAAHSRDAALAAAAAEAAAAAGSEL